MTIPLILASASARRTALLEQMGFAHQQLPVDIDESGLPGEPPAALVARLAEQKARAAFARLGPTEQRSAVVLGSDTLIAYAGESLGKPADKEDCIATLLRLSDNLHQVLTAICVVNAADSETQIITTEVQFAPVTRAEIERYWATGEPADKAGSYAIQGIGGQFVRSVNGSVSAVIGLPLYETKCLLHKFGVVE
ncbi:Maf family protein [Salinimonas sediminis]|uniref:dTTP/UTP pyrophosphatase n=1 Tax=Salinimonas sediminis TaxID=2303538 RepID=A0A346NRF0_9ALTE|nr:Maf family protein [Salinimonas sediminis]AXR08107.1 septum formation inhibitor Maf [Salinimonas sediminis]